MKASSLSAWVVRRVQFGPAPSTRTHSVPFVRSLRTGHTNGTDEPDHPGAFNVNVWHEAGKDLLTLTPPAGSYVGPAMVPWMTCLVCSVAAGVVTVRYGRPMWGSLPLILAGVIAIVWGPTHEAPSSLLVIAWWVGLIVWWAWASAIGRARMGADIVIGMSASSTTASTTMGVLSCTCGGAWAWVP